MRLWMQCPENTFWILPKRRQQCEVLIFVILRKLLHGGLHQQKTEQLPQKLIENEADKLQSESQPQQNLVPNTEIPFYKPLCYNDFQNYVTKGKQPFTETLCQ
ncbi:MAG: hypothetical protein LBC20_08015 [Planctomycetaceae bacterium]|jgi:hypothetical protein|nr:hypothetical protein [Planctomycetaceae bacterium]